MGHPELNLSFTVTSLASSWATQKDTTLNGTHRAEGPLIQSPSQDRNQYLDADSGQSQQC